MRSRRPRHSAGRSTMARRWRWGCVPPGCSACACSAARRATSPGRTPCSTAAASTARRRWSGAVVDALEEERGRADGCIINPGGLTHTSVVLADAVRAFGKPVIEVHLSNILAREAFRRVSLCAEAAAGVITGLGARGYTLALDGLVTMIEAPKPEERPT